MNVTQITIGAAAEAVKVLFKSRTLPPYIHGSPGIGKSAIARAIADSLNLFFIDVRLSDREPTDLCGLPTYNEAKTRATYLPFDEFPLAGDAKPVNPEGKEYDGWLVMLDEFSNALPAVQSAAYKFTLDRKVGEYDLHEDCYVMAAGNLETDGALAQPMSTALISRFAHLYVQPDLQEWVQSVQIDNIDIVAYLNFRPQQFNTFRADLTTPYACSRTWKEVDKVLTQVKALPDTSRKVLAQPLLESLLGRATVADFRTFLEVKNEIVDFETIMLDPLNAPVPPASKLGLLWATTFMVVEKMTEKNLDACNSYLKRLPSEVQAAAARGALIRHKELMNTQVGRNYRTDVYRRLFKNL